MTFTTLAWWHWASDVFVDFFGGKLKTVNQKTNMASKQGCGTDCGWLLLLFEHFEEL